MRILNLVGGVLLFLFGMFYRLVPAAERHAGESARLASNDRRDPVSGGVAVVLLKGPSFEAAADWGSLIVIARWRCSW